MGNPREGVEGRPRREEGRGERRYRWREVDVNVCVEWSAMVSSSNPPPTPIPTPTQARPGQQQQQQHNHYRPPMPPTGFGGLTLRRGKKPIIAAVNGLAHGGGFEILTNVDIVLASPHATFVLPEVKRGVVAIAGALPRLPRIVGRMRAMEMVLLGREIGVWEGVRWGFVNAVADAEDEGGKTGGGKGEGVVAMAVRWAREIAERNSPDAVVVSKAGVDMAWEGAGGVTEASERIREGELWRGLERGENMREGLRAFGEKRAPRWVDSKL